VLRAFTRCKDVLNTVTGDEGGDGDGEVRSMKTIGHEGARRIGVGDLRMRSAFAHAGDGDLSMRPAAAGDGNEQHPAGSGLGDSKIGPCQATFPPGDGIESMVP
jgi:hypothetical protein